MRNKVYIAPREKRIKGRPPNTVSGPPPDYCWNRFFPRTTISAP